MSTHSLSSPKDPALAPNLSLLDRRTSTPNPTDMRSDSNRQSISREPSQIAEGVHSGARDTRADASKYVGLGTVEQTPELSSDNQSASTRTTKSPAPSLYAQPANRAPQDDTDSEIQRHILAILQKMCDNMEGPEEEVIADNGRPISTGAGTGAQPHKALFKKTLLGVPKRLDQAQQFNPVNEDYEQIFPEDPYGEEAGPNARVFKVYNEEAAAYDADMIGQSSDSSDVLLVFAGLFSAVLTTFVAQTSQALDTDNSAISNSLLSEVVHLLRAQENGTSFVEVAPAITGTVPTANDLWVNGLWFTSLTLSLATALFAVLTKQWLRQYMVKTSGTIRDRSLIRQFRFAGMRKWHVVAIIGILPILLHLALGVFLVGLVIFLVPRSLPIACVVSAITVIIYSLYFISNLIPVFDIQCPYRTPLSDILNILLVDAQNLFSIALEFICKHLIPCIPSERDFYRRTYHFKPLGVQEHDQVQGQWGSLSLDIIKWLLDTSSNPSVHTVATEAIGGLPPSQREKVNFLHQHFTRDLIEKCLIFSGRAPACRPGCVGKLERLARSFPLSQRKRSNDVPRWDIYAAFHDLKDIRGMVSAIGLGFNKGEDGVNTLNHLLDLPDVRLSPCAWVNLFKNIYGARMTECRLEICKRVLERWDPIPQPHSWKEQTAPVPMSYVLTRGFLEVGLLGFGDCDPFKNLDTTESLPLPLDSILRPPDSPGLRALLTMHHFLDRQNTYESSIDVLFLLHLLWQHVHNELHRHPTALDYVAVFHTASRSLLESPVLKGNKWMDCEATSGYCSTLLELCSYALFYGPFAAPEFEWNCAERVVELTFREPTADVASKDYTALTSRKAVYLWGCALVRDIKGAFTDFVKFNVLGRQAAFLHVSESLIRNFISGLLRQLQEHPSPHPEWVSDGVTYLHAPDNLLKACKILAGHSELASEDTFLELARVDPDNMAWEGCREKLRAWRPDDTDLVATFEDSLKALDRFFETRRRRLNPASLLRSVFGRRGNASVVCPSTDVEMGLRVTASPNELSESQERTNPVVAGELITELDREDGETSRGGDLAVGSQLRNETDVSLRRSSRGLVTEIALAQDTSLSLDGTSRESVSGLSMQPRRA